MGLRRFPSLRALVLVLTACVGAAALQAAAPQVDSNSAASLHGHVVDESGAAVKGARITIVLEGLSTETVVTSDERGDFDLTLGPGKWIVTVSAPGFADNSQTVVAERSGIQSRQFILHVAGVRESVSVTAAETGYRVAAIDTATRTPTPLRDVPQSVTVVTKELIRDRLMSGISDLVRYVPGIMAHQGENNRDQIIIRGNNSSADFFLNGVRDDVQYYRDLYNLERVEALKGPNAMIFGRGGGGGVINRVTKEAVFDPAREFTLLTGSFGNRRIAADLNQPLSDRVSARFNGMYENADSFRQGVNLERYGLSPTVTLVPADGTRLVLGYEHLHDQRTADRGIPSFGGRPVDTDISTYFGNPQDTYVHASVDLLSGTLEHQIGTMAIRNRTLIGHYRRGYQNFVPGTVTPDRTRVALSAYNNATERLNLFNQTDVTSQLSTGRFRHVLLAGIELGRQGTDNLRNTGYFDNGATTVLVPFEAPIVSSPVAFHQSATDANNRLRTSVAAAYLQDQIELRKWVLVMAGVRGDSFDLRYRNNRTGDDLRRVDRLWSPRAGLVVKPIVPLSIYGSYTVSHLPSSGDQFSSLTTVTEQVKPERFVNYETGVKWDLNPGLSLTMSVYRLDRTNTRSTDPNDPTRIVQTGSQRTNGYEAGLSGRPASHWQIAAGYSYQSAFVTSATTAAPAGARVAQVPRHNSSLWNMYQIHPKLGLGVGIVQRTDMFAAIDNLVTLPGYIEAEAAMYVTLTPNLRAQANVDNLFNRVYYANADNNTNISPGAPRAVRLAVVARF
jgi:catecholate siderophore receptor